MVAKNPDVIDTTTTPGYAIAEFTTIGTGTYTIPAGVTTVEYLVVGGGGAGWSSISGGAYADGGHAGQYSTATGFAVTAGGTVTVTVGDYGASSGGNGGSSVFSTTTSTGGLGGADRSNSLGVVYGGDGSSHIGYISVNPYGGNGGAGNSNSITGAVVDYCSGGGSGGYYAGTAGGDSGADGGGSSDGGQTGGAAANNRGGGGGGAAGSATLAGGNGGSGVVIIKYLVPSAGGGGTGYGSACMMCVGM